MKLCQKLKKFSRFFSAVIKLDQILKILKKKMSLIADVFQKLLTAKCVVTYMPKKPRVRTFMDSQYVKGSKTLLKSSPQEFFHIS